MAAGSEHETQMVIVMATMARMVMDGKDIRKKHQPTSTNIISGFQPVDSHLTLENANLKTAPGSPKPADFFEELRMQQLSKVFDHKDRMVGWDGMGCPQVSNFSQPSQ